MEIDLQTLSGQEHPRNPRMQVCFAAIFTMGADVYQTAAPQELGHDHVAITVFR